MKKLLLLGIMAVALMAAGTASAALTMDAGTGIVRVPTADTMAPMSLGVGVDYVASEDTQIPIRVELGVIEGLELGANYDYVDSEGIDNIMGANVKFRIPMSVVEGLGIAVGGQYQKMSLDIEGAEDPSTILGYLVASYDLKLEGFGLQPTVAVSYESESNVGGGDDDETGVRFALGLNATVMENLSVGVDFVSTNDDLDGEDADSSIGVVARFIPLENLTVQAGVLNNANIGGDSDEVEDYVFFVGAQYALNFGK